MALLPSRQPGGACFSFVAFPPPMTTSSRRSEDVHVGPTDVNRKNPQRCFHQDSFVLQASRERINVDARLGELPEDALAVAAPGQIFSRLGAQVNANQGVREGSG